MKLDLNWGALATVVVCALVLTGCAAENDERDSMGSHLAQPPHGAKRPPPTDAGDIALVGQDVAQSILRIPAIAEASTPPLVRFNGVTSIITPPVDTAPYTQLLRDRLLLLTREKLRFVEHSLPPYSPGGHHKHVDVSDNGGDAEYQVLAEMRGQPKAPTYKIQIEFIEVGSGNVLFNQTYRINKEDEGQPSASDYTPPMAPQPTGQQAPPPQSQPKNTSGVNANGDPNNPPPGYYEPKPSTGNGGGGGVL